MYGSLIGSITFVVDLPFGVLRLVEETAALRLLRDLLDNRISFESEDSKSKEYRTTVVVHDYGGELGGERLAKTCH